MDNSVKSCRNAKTDRTLKRLLNVAQRSLVIFREDQSVGDKSWIKAN